MPKELHLSLLPGLHLIRDEQGHWRTEADEDVPVESPRHQTHIRDLFRQSDDFRLLGLQGASHNRLLGISSYVANLDPIIRPKFQAYATIAQAQSHLAGGDLDTARSVLAGGPREDPRVAAILHAVEGAYAVRQSERIIQVVSAAALIAQKRIGGFENWADGDRRSRIMNGLQGWAQNYRTLVEEGRPPLEAFERMKFWVMDLESVGQVMNEENLWDVVGGIGSMDIAATPRPEERMAFTMLHVADRLSDRHEGEAAQHLYGVLENSPARDSARERLSHLDGDLRSGEIRRFLRSFTPWTAERSSDFYGTLITIGTMAVSGGIGGLAGRFVAREAASALAGQIVSVATQAALQPVMSQGLDPIADGTYVHQVVHNAVLMGGLGLGHAAAERIGGGLLTNLGVSVAGMTTFDLMTDPRNFDVSPHLLIANSLGNDLIGRASGVTQRGLEATRIAQERLEATMERGLDALARTILPLGRPVLGMAVGNMSGNSGGATGRVPSLLAVANLREMTAHVITSFFQVLAPVGRTGMDRAREHILNRLVDDLVPRLERYREMATAESINDRQVVELISKQVIRTMRAHWTHETFGLVGEIVRPENLMVRLNEIESTAESLMRSELRQLRERFSGPVTLGATMPLGALVGLENVFDTAQYHPMTVAAMIAGVTALSVALGAFRNANFMGDNRSSNRNASYIVDRVIAQLSERGINVERGEIEAAVHLQMAHFKENSGGRRNGDAGRENYPEIEEQALADFSGRGAGHEAVPSLNNNAEAFYWIERFIEQGTSRAGISDSHGLERLASRLRTQLRSEYLNRLMSEYGATDISEIAETGFSESFLNSFEAVAHSLVREGIEEVTNAGR